VRKAVPDLIGAGLLIALGAAFAIGATQYGLFGEGGRIGPGFMPFAAGTLLIVFGTMIAAEGMLRSRRPSRPVRERRSYAVGGGTAPAGGGEGAQGRSVAVAFGLMLITILLVPVLGFLVSFGLLILALVTFVEREGWLRGILLSVGSVAVTWLAFVEFFKIPLPSGIVGQLLGF
jgi:putative tricarboxylic transport membrane protein